LRGCEASAPIVGRGISCRTRPCSKQAQNLSHFHEQQRRDSAESLKQQALRLDCRDFDRKGTTRGSLGRVRGFNDANYLMWRCNTLRFGIWTCGRAVHRSTAAMDTGMVRNTKLHLILVCLTAAGAALAGTQCSLHFNACIEYMLPISRTLS
jgi:hypothetical protein